jgi:hypothetical protein
MARKALMLLARDGRLDGGRGERRRNDEHGGRDPD